MAKAMLCVLVAALMVAKEANSLVVIGGSSYTLLSPPIHSSFSPSSPRNLQPNTMGNELDIPRRPTLRMQLRESSDDEGSLQYIDVPGKASGMGATQTTAVLSLFSLFPASAMADVVEAGAEASKIVIEPRGITAQDTVVFVIGVIPFVWATYEFWRRIAVGEPFGTTKEGSVIIRPEGQEVKEQKGSPRRVLSTGAIRLAYVLFAAVGASMALVVVAVLQAGSRQVDGARW
ncbi:hypothetical protein GUITHDRAFT_166674 [Guillardia theta CCMP2712]|uniref:Uncharacterized protein n=1 Tax=Guillardia theta (strain CCMP2712) TaxID=905079 RepID=L1I8L3_GUITC|nr:hypothetical protein GUITHDRAFT_166674 [Guillardia theta CCMP2712]EKX32568.1 hypothetical protein GUITHDRAFT_166674 [Guillardia theta CCMP2712]|eukprot:XP_005819548.1 hypothetical protein GUITHDRAFT_166674 [Guillardia theta CCMP2712]